MKKLVALLSIMLVVPVFGSTSFNLDSFNSLSLNSLHPADLDPLTDLGIHVSIERARKIIVDEEPSFSFKITVNGQTWGSDTFHGYDILSPCNAYFDIPDDKEEINILIVLLENGEEADISANGKSLSIVYDVKTGGWNGDDFRGDISGYGHSGGHEDGVIDNEDYEIWFDIIQNDYDGDGLTYWEETNVYHTDPMQSDYGKDYDNDGIPIEWEDKWGYNPFSYDGHSKLDPDYDGLQNTEEYMMSNWFADPLRQDIFIEVDCMVPSPSGVKHEMPEESIQMLYSAFTRHNIMLLLDTGNMGGSDEIPYDESLNWDELKEIYEKYFLHNDQKNPRKGIFHYAIICHEIIFWRRPAGGMNFRRDAFVLGSAYIQKWRPWEKGMKISHASLFMHELGHSLGLNDYIGIDNERTRFPWQLQYWLFGNYKSCMNYRYAFKLIDYSDGSHGFLDHDDWGSLDLQRFER